MSRACGGRKLKRGGSDPSTGIGSEEEEESTEEGESPLYYVAGALAGFVPGLAWQAWEWPGVAGLALAALGLGLAGSARVGRRVGRELSSSSGVRAWRVGWERTMERDRSHRAWYWLLLVPLVGLLIPPLYNHADPEFIGLPFFYWYQLAWVPISVAVTALVYRKTREPEE